MFVKITAQAPKTVVYIQNYEISLAKEGEKKKETKEKKRKIMLRYTYSRSLISYNMLHPNNPLSTKLHPMSPPTAILPPCSVGNAYIYDKQLPAISHSPV